MNKELESLMRKYNDLKACKSDILQAFEMMKESYEKGNKLLVCGNGGSAADSDHIVGELMKGFKLQRPIPEDIKEEINRIYPEDGEYISNHLQGALPAISLTNNGILATAFANDVAADMIFAQQVYGYGVKGDVLMGISTSGNSVNVIKAIQIAKALGIRTIGLTGASGGRMKELCDVTICVPYKSTPDIQERHLPVYHTLCLMLEGAFFEQ